MRVLVLTTSYPAPPAPFAGHFVARLVAGYEGAGHGVHVVTPWTGASNLQEGGGVLDTLGAKPWHAVGIPAAVAHLAARVWGAATGMATGVVVSHWLLPCGWVGSELARRRRWRHIAYVHSGDLWVAEHVPGARAMARRALQGADAVIATSHSAMARTLRLSGHLSPPAHWHILPLGVDDPAPPPARGKQRTLYLGRLVPQKRVDMLIRACALAGLPLTVAGAGAAEKALRAQASTTRADIHFVGPVPLADRMAMIAAHRVVALPSWQTPRGRVEGLPQVIAEAVASEVRAVAGSAGAAAELLRDGHNGAVFDGPAEGALAAALRRAWDAPGGFAATPLNPRPGALLWRNLMPKHVALLI